MKIYVRQEIFLRKVISTSIFITSSGVNERYRGIQFCLFDTENKVELYSIHTDTIFCKKSLESDWKLMEL